MAAERTGYAAGAALTGVGGTFDLIFLGANPGKDPFGSGWFVFCLIVAIFGAVVVLLTCLGHFVSGWQRRVRIDPVTKQMYIAVTQKHLESLTSMDAQNESSGVLPHKSLVITPRRQGTFGVMSSDEPNYNGLIEVRVRAYVANHPDSASATLSTARATIQLDDYPMDLVETQVSQYAPRGGEIPDGYTYPPVVPTGETLEIECAFWTHTQGSPRGGWIQPHGGVIVGFTLIDLFGIETRFPKNIEFSVSHVLPGWELGN